MHINRHETEPLYESYRSTDEKAETSDKLSVLILRHGF